MLVFEPLLGGIDEFTDGVSAFEGEGKGLFFLVVDEEGDGVSAFGEGFGWLVPAEFICHLKL